MTTFMRGLFESVGMSPTQKSRAQSNILALQRMEKTFDSIWKTHGTLLRESRRYTAMVADFESSVAKRSFTYRQYLDARSVLPSLENSTLQSRKLRSRLNRLVYKCRQFAKQVEIEDPKRKDAAFALLGVIRAIEVSISDLAKQHEVTFTKLSRAIRGAANAALNAKADLQFTEGFTSAAVDNYLRVLLGAKSQDEERTYAARKLMALSVSLDDSALADISRGYFQGVGQKFGGKLSDVVPFISSLQAGERRLRIAELHQVIALAKSTKTAESALATANLFIGLDDLPALLTQELQSDWISFALEIDQLEPVRQRIGESGTMLDTLQAEIPSDCYISGVEKVTVLMPARNSAPWIGTAIRSALEQTWRSLELIVIDDASEDDTLKIAMEFARSDSRVRVIPVGQQKGAYGARNIGLDSASGEFITVHDADDWSHPRKIERQVKHLIQNPNLVANMSQSARVTDFDLKFQNYLGREILRQNSSSLMCRKEVFQLLGYWDEVKFGADTEFHHRILAAFGKDSAPVIQAGVLSFTRFHEASLTGGGVGSMANGVAGARAVYAANFNAWHEENASIPEQLRLEKSANPRPFEVGVASVSNLGTHSRELLVLGDFTESSDLWRLMELLFEEGELASPVAIRHEPDAEQPDSLVGVPDSINSEHLELLERELEIEVETLIVQASRASSESSRSKPIRAKRVLVVETTDLAKEQNGEPMFQLDPSGEEMSGVSLEQVVGILKNLRNEKSENTGPKRSSRKRSR